MARMDGKFLHSESAMIRKLSCVAYCLATIAATLVWAGVTRVGRSSPVWWIGAVPEALLVWWIVAGVALRLVRLVERVQARSAGKAEPLSSP